MKTAKKHTAPCKTCESGVMHRRKKYVLGAGGAILRFMLMVPGVLMLIIGVIGTLSSGEAMSSVTEERKEMIESLRADYVERGLSPGVVDEMLERGDYPGNWSQLSEAERNLLRRLQADYVAIQMDEALSGGVAVVAGGISLALVIGGLVMMAFGFIIGIRKWKLICDSCGTSINAA